MLISATLFLILLAQPVAAVEAASSDKSRVVREQFYNETARLRSLYNSMSADLEFSKNIALRAAYDQALRKALPAKGRSGLSPADEEALHADLWLEIAKIDAENTAYLKRVLPAEGWFRTSRYGTGVASDAWIIVQHSSDHRFQAKIARIMKRFVKMGEASASKYALLFDRTELHAGRPQRYGTQVRCTAGKWVLAPLTDPADVDAKRAKVGLRPIARYLRSFSGAC